MRIGHLLLVAVAACSGARSSAPRSPAAAGAALSGGKEARDTLPVPVRTGDVHDFDFEVGTWTVHNRTLKIGSEGHETWTEFPSTVCTRQHLGRVVNVEEIWFPTKGYAAIALRTFDLAKRQWSIYWIDGRTGVLLPPVVGGFEGDRGEFYSRDVEKGRPVLYRFVWLQIGSDRARWEQASSPDGVEWKANWVMEFTRMGSSPNCSRT
jgi:hypothetical protein